MVSAVRVASSSLRGVVREADIRAFESWRNLFVSPRRGAPGGEGLPVAARAAPVAPAGLKREGRSGGGHDRRREDERSGDASAVSAKEDVTTTGGHGAGAKRRAAAGGKSVGQGLLSFPPMLSPVFSLEAAFDALRLEVAGDDADDVVGGSVADYIGGFGGAKAGGGSAAAGGKSTNLSRSAESASASSSSGASAASVDGDSIPRSEHSGEFEQWQWRWRRRSQVRRRSGAPGAVAEVKGVHAGVKIVVSSSSSSGDVDSGKVCKRRLLVVTPQRCSGRVKKNLELFRRRVLRGFLVRRPAFCVVVKSPSCPFVSTYLVLPSEKAIWNGTYCSRV